MGKLSPRSFFKIRVGTPGRIALGGAPEMAAIDQGSSRRLFLQSTAGAVSGAAMILAAPKVASIALNGSNAAPAAEPKPVVTQPSGPAPREPVMAYVRDARRGEVTVMNGTRETTYRDPVLVKRLLDRAR